MVRDALLASHGEISTDGDCNRIPEAYEKRAQSDCGATSHYCIYYLMVLHRTQLTSSRSR